jgi:hypothetical protein
MITVDGVMGQRKAGSEEVSSMTELEFLRFFNSFLLFGEASIAAFHHRNLHR